MFELEKKKLRPHPLHWIVEPLMEEPSYLEKAMFGCRGCYLHGRLKLVLASRQQEPWKGVLIPTERQYHASLTEEFPRLKTHPVLGKWFYLPLARDDFEPIASKLIELITRDDPRIGVIPKAKKVKVPKA